MFPRQCEELRINHLTPLLVVTVPYASWFLWQADHIEDFKWRLHFQLGVAFWRVVLREVYFERPNHIWSASKTSSLNTGWGCGCQKVLAIGTIQKEVKKNPNQWKPIGKHFLEKKDKSLEKDGPGTKSWHHFCCGRKNCRRWLQHHGVERGEFFGWAAGCLKQCGECFEGGCWFRRRSSLRLPCKWGSCSSSGGPPLALNLE